MRKVLALVLAPAILLRAACNPLRTTLSSSPPPTPSLSEAAKNPSATEPPPAQYVETKLVTITAIFQSRQATVGAEGPFPQVVDTATPDLRPSPTSN